jgi:A/G-specific adenine glycosylase
MRFVRRSCRVAHRSSPAGRGLPPGAVRKLLEWFYRTRRPLPWRRSRDPYRIWVAEVLLQQTRVAQAVPYFERFVARFPNVRALATADLEEVLKLWQGAGYYARARHLHEAARLLVRDAGGSMPRSAEELERLPGVGPYTARAVAALAFGEKVVPLDANVLRVSARWAGESRDVRRASVRSALGAGLARSLPSRDPGGFAEALMELGETVCLPREPHCERCPVSASCRAFLELDDPGSLPRRPPRRTRPHRRVAIVALRRGGRWLVQHRPADRLLGGLWEFPGGKIEGGEQAIDAARRELAEETGAETGPLRYVGIVRHGYSHFTVELHVYQGSVRRPPRLGRDRRWATLAEIERLPLPRATEKVLRLLRRPADSARLGTA